MERLNEILGRTSPRQPQRSAQRPYQESVSEEQVRDTRDVQAGRQSSDEPTTRPAHRYPSFMQNGQPRYQAAPNSESSDLSHPAKSAYSHYRNAQAPTDQDAHGGERTRAQRFAADAQMHYRQQNTPQQDARRPHLPQPQYSQMDSGTDYQLQNRSHYEEPRIEPLPPRQTTDFSNKSYPRAGQPRRADDYAPSLRADALDEWEVGGMGYGDWEKDDPTDYEEEEIQIIEDDEASPSIYQVYPPRSMNAETPSAYAPYTHTPIDLPHLNQKRDYREYDGYEQYPSLPRASQPTTPSSTYQQAPQEQEYQQRMTQPLDPQMVTDIQRESRTAQAAQPVQSTDQRILRALRKTAPEKKIEPIKLPETIDVVSAPKAPCPLCHGAGYLRANVPFGHPNFGKPVQCECKEAEQRDKRRQQLREMSNMDSFRDHTFKTFRNSIIGVKEAYQVAVEFANEPDGWLLLVGPNGCGKTHLAAAIANQQLLRGGVVLFEAVPDLLDHLRAAFAPTATEVYDQLFSKMREAELLILDDLGAQQSSPWANEKLFQLLNYRYNMGAPTVITANPRGMTAVDERVRSRLNDHSLVRQVSMDHVRDYRPNNTRKR